MINDTKPHLHPEPISGSAQNSILTIEPVEKEEERNDVIELFRVVAACGIVWFHMELVPCRNVGLAGLIFFLTIGVIFQKQAAERVSSQRYFLKRALRLLLPWIVWFVIYGLLNCVTGKSLFPHSSGFVEDLLTGPWIGLWFLPFSFACACVVFAAVKCFCIGSPFVNFFICLILSLLFLVLVVICRVSTPFVAPWAQYLQAVPSIPIGFAFAFALACLPNSFRMLVILQGGILLTCGGLYLMDPGLAVSYSLGTVLVAVSFGFQRKLRCPIRDVSSLCMGVYLIHGAVMSGFKIIPWVTQHYLMWTGTK